MVMDDGQDPVAPCLSEQVFASLVGCPGQMDFGGRGLGDEGGRGVEMRGSVPVIRFLSLSHPSADPTETWRHGKTKSSNTFLIFWLI